MPRKAKKTAEDYTRDELYARAESKGIKYRSRMNKEQLFEALGLGKTRKKAAAKKAAPNKKATTAKTKAAKRKPAARKPAKKAATKTTGKTPAREVAAKKKAAPAKRKAVAKKKAPAKAKAKVKATAKRRAPGAGTKPKATAKKKARPAAELEPVSAEPKSLPSSSVVPPPAMQAAAAAYVDRGPKLPDGYGDDRVVALVRDPRCIFAYWELGGGGYERARDELGSEMAGAVWVLRLVKVVGERFFDVPIDPATGNWYLHVEPSERYQVKIGIVLPSGVFRELAASSEIVTPAERVSDVVDEEWMLVREEFDRLIEQILSVRAPGGIGSSEILHRLSNIPRRMELFSGSITSPRGGGR